MSGFFYGLLLPLTLMGGAATLLLVCLQAGFARAGKHFSGLPAWGLAACFFLLPVSSLRTGPLTAGATVLSAFFGGRLTPPAQSTATLFRAVSGPQQGLADGALKLAALTPVGKVLPLVPALWLAGALVALFLLVRRLHRFSLRITRARKPLESPNRQAQFQRIRGELRLGKAVQAYQITGIRSPFTYGLLRPAIYLPEKALPAAAEEWAIRHELLHIKRAHLWYKAAGECALLLHWFNPLAHTLKRKLDASCEIDCDLLATKGMGTAERKAYGALLLRLAEPMQTEGAFALSRQGRQLSARLLALRHTLPAKQQTCFAALLAVLLLLPCAPAAAACESTVQSTVAGATLLNRALAHAEDFLPTGEGGTPQSAVLLNPEALIDLVWPVPDYRYCSRVQNSGLSIVAEPQTDIVAAADGVVLATSAGEGEIKKSYGQTVVLVHSEGPDISTCYTHCAALFVQPGDTVKAGQVIAAVGSTGEVSGAMCRYQVCIDGVLYNPARWYPDAALGGDLPS